MADATYSILHEAEEIVGRLCDKYPEQLSNVDKASISVISIEGKDRPEKSHTWAKIKGIKPPISLLTHGKVYIIQLYQTDWENWTAAQRNIVLFHELLHIEGEGGNKKHDVEDFRLLLKNLGIDYVGNPELPDILEKTVDWSGK